MTNPFEAHDVELLDTSAPSKGSSTVRKKKNKLISEDTEIIEIPSSSENEEEDIYDIDPEELIVTPKAHSSARKQDTDFDLGTSPEILANPIQDSELLAEEADLDDSFEDFDDSSVIELGSSLPALAQDRLPSVPVRDNLQSYLREVSRFPLLEPEEETALARRVRDQGDAEAAFRIVSSHLRLVVRIAMDFQRRWMQNVLDLIQEGNVGLLRAVNKFDPDKGIKFSYYASFWIKAYILKFIMDNWRMVKIGTTQAQRKLFYNLNRERQKLILQGFDPDSTILSQRLGVTQDQVIEMQQRLDASDVSLDVPVSDENGSASRMDFLPAVGPGVEDDIADAEMSLLVRRTVESLMPSLSEKEIFILENRLLTDEPATLREIGERYNVTRERIRQLEARLLEKLKEHLSRELKDFSEDWIIP